MPGSGRSEGIRRWALLFRAERVPVPRQQHHDPFQLLRCVLPGEPPGRAHRGPSPPSFPSPVSRGPNRTKPRSSTSPTRKTGELEVYTTNFVSEVLTNITGGENPDATPSFYPSPLRAGPGMVDRASASDNRSVRFVASSGISATFRTPMEQVLNPCMAFPETNVRNKAPELDFFKSMYIHNVYKSNCFTLTTLLKNTRLH